ncbi:DUF6283 family protein [Limnobacter alexandrii]|uniref:DUF6283 family protein n=1 Tax=Limnobacter alexandrii TaxID=2570352 RepID=UPI00110805FC|nr:DUF6283 family protein [Limnobacter alexandrii]
MAEIKKSRQSRIEKITPADHHHQVVSVAGGGHEYRKSPCKSCPWRTSQVGTFPAQAFRISAHTAYDMADRTFGCHESGHKKPSTCAGFLLRGADHNLAVRLGKAKGRYLDVLNADGAELFDSYREMAVANGVEPSDPVLTLCRN